MKPAVFLLALLAFQGQNEDVRYSTQTSVLLDPGDRTVFTLKNGSTRDIRLLSVKEHRDPVVRLMRRAEVEVEIDGKKTPLTCSPYDMPVEINGLRIQVDTTDGWLMLQRKVQLTLWDATDPIVDPKKFVFPLRSYRLFSHPMQAYNEPVHLGHGDGDPGKQVFYHNYGVDLAGYEGAEEVVSPIEGFIVKIQPHDGKPSSVFIEDDGGTVFELGHLDSIADGLEPGIEVRRGQKIGMIGKTGYSGNYSHLHVGAFRTRDDMEDDRRDRRLNLFPWLVAAYRAQYPEGLYAVARPHHRIFEGESVRFDGTRSLAFDSQVTSWNWEFHDGTRADGAVAKKTFGKPGTYIATLRVKDAKGRSDVDFCKVKVFRKSDPTAGIPILFLTHTPTRGVRAGQEVSFRFWMQGAEQAGPGTIDFGDGTVLKDVPSYKKVTHVFKTPGIHIVTVRTVHDGLPITQKCKVLTGQRR